MNAIGIGSLTTLTRAYALGHCKGHPTACMYYMWLGTCSIYLSNASCKVLAVFRNTVYYTSKEFCVSAPVWRGPELKEL